MKKQTKPTSKQTHKEIGKSTKRGHSIGARVDDHGRWNEGPSYKTQQDRKRRIEEEGKQTREKKPKKKQGGGEGGDMWENKNKDVGVSMSQDQSRKGLFCFSSSSICWFF